MRTRARTWVGVTVLAALGLALRVAIALRDLDVLDRWFIQDDAYYTWTIARSLARGLGPRADPEVLTSGFQPLLAFLEVPLFWLTTGSDAPQRATLLGLAVIDVGLALLLGRLAARALGGTCGWIACAAWLLSPQAIALALGGLESTLALALLVATLAAWSAHRRAPTRGRALALGAWIGAALLARVDAVFFIGALGLCELVWGERRLWPYVVASASAVVAPWWLYLLSTFGSVVPESGAAVRELAFLYQGPQVVGRAWIWSAACVAANALVDLGVLRRAMAASAVGAPLALGWWIAYALVATSVLRRASRVERLPLALLVAHGGALALFYSTYVPAVWFFPRYLCVAQLCACVLFAALAARGLASARATLRAATLATTALVLGSAAWQSSAFLWREPELAARWTIEGPTGYRAPMRAALAQLPPGAVVGSLQSGALGYLAAEGIEVVNLDGVVSGPAARALAERRLGAYARARGVTHFCDWPLQHELLAARAGTSLELRALWETQLLQPSAHAVRLSALEISPQAPVAGAP